jgi:maltose/moltooligosaccharide transporter
MNKQVSVAKLLLLGFGFFSILLVETIYDNIIPLMLRRNYIPDNEMMIGFIMTIDNIIALFILPFVGFLSDRIMTRFGRRMPFIMVGMPLASLFLILLPNHFSLASLILFIIGMNVSMHIFRSPVIALMPDITEQSKRGLANSLINFVGGFGAVTATLLGMLLFEKSESYPFILASVLLLLSFVILFTNIVEKRDVIVYEDEEKVKIWDSLKIGFKRKEVVLLLLAITSWFIAYNGLQTFFTSYGDKYLGITDSQSGITLTFMSGFFLLFAVPAGVVGHIFGKKNAIITGLLGVIGMMLILIFTKELWIIQVCFIFVGIFWACVNINAFPFVANLAPIGQIGAFTGLYYFFSTLSRIVSPPLLGKIIDLAGWQSLFIYSAVFFGIALVLLLNVKVSKEI